METLETLKEKFSQIGYTVKGHDINTFLYDNNKVNTGFRIYGNQIEKKIGEGCDYNKISVVLMLDRITISLIDENCISVCDSCAPENTGLFINFYNFDNGK